MNKCAFWGSGSYRLNLGSIPAKPPTRMNQADFAWEVLQFQSKSIKLGLRYCTFEKLSFSAPRQNDFLCATTVHVKQPVLLIFFIFARRIDDSANHLKGIAHICKSGQFVSEVLHFSNLVVCRRSKNSVLKNAIPLERNA